MSSPSTPKDGRERVVIEGVRPELDGGRFPVKRTLGDELIVWADIFADGHDTVAGVLRYRHIPPGASGTRATARAWHETPVRLVDNDRWTGRFVVLELGRYEYTLEAWVDAFATWRAALAKRLDAGQVTEGDLLEGGALVKAAAARATGVARGGRSRARPGATGESSERAVSEGDWLNAQAAALESPGDLDARARQALDSVLTAVMARHPDRSRVSSYGRTLAVLAERERARFGAWYEMFPRSAVYKPGRGATLREAAARLPDIAAMGFDVLYLPPIHPIGTTARKGPGNTPTSKPGDPGSPWAIGSPAGGHKAVDPGLGTLEDFDWFLAAAREAGLEIALDLAYQCSPDHPYVREHPEWFRHRPDGTIKYAENPPKKYQDIYPFDFDSADWPSLWIELRSIVTFWADRGVLIFRVDNPHTKPFKFWEWLIGSVRESYPEAVFLSEAFTRPRVMQQLAKLGFTQSYSYFTWRNTKTELTEYFTELTGTAMQEYFRPNLFANTPDILHAYLQEGGPPAFQVRLILAAMLGASYGLYSGFELCENRAVPGTEEYLNSEKYEYPHWDWHRPGHIKDLVRAVNAIRRSEPALHFNDGLRFHDTDNPQILAFSKSRDSSSVLVIVNLDPSRMHHGWVRTPFDELAFGTGPPYHVEDLLDSSRYVWTDDWNYVRLDPGERVAHVLKPAGRR